MKNNKSGNKSVNTLKNLEKFGDQYGTLNLNPGKKIYEERFTKKGGKEYRIWNPYRSKLGTALVKKLRTFPFKEDSTVLYLGAGNGTTPSHISDICTNGQIYCVEFSPRATIDLYSVSETRKNLIPILGDANKPEEYSARVSKADILYQDVAQRFQVDIFKKNVDMFLNENGIGFLMVKARSIDVTKEPDKVFNKVIAELSTDFEILEKINLNPYEKDHMCIVVKK